MTDEPAERPSPWRRLRRFVVESVVLVVLAVVVAAVLRVFVVQPFFVPSGSMQPTIEKHERIVVKKFGEVERGDVVVFEDPAAWLPPAERPERRTGVLGRGMEFVGLLPPSDKGYLVKRLIGLPGDHVVCCDGDGRLTVNDQPLAETDYLFTGNKPSEEPFDVVVPRDRVWVMGDHRLSSGDSRVHLGPEDRTAFVPMDNVVGRAFAAVWPIGDTRWLDRPTTFEAVPKPSKPAPGEPVVNAPPGRSDARR